MTIGERNELERGGKIVMFRFEAADFFDSLSRFLRVNDLNLTIDLTQHGWNRDALPDVVLSGLSESDKAKFLMFVTEVIKSRPPRT